MDLKSFDFPPILNTSDADIIADFFVPALGTSVRYDRGVGFLVPTGYGWRQKVRLPLPAVVVRRVALSYCRGS